MGHPCAGFAVITPLVIEVLSNILSLITFRSVLAKAFSHNPFFNQQQQEQQQQQQQVHEEGLAWPSLEHIPIYMYAASRIKGKLPVIIYSAFMEKNRIQDDEEALCAVCLNGVESSHEIRELSNCCHVFHRECMDTWLDQGQLTCPFCRSPLLTDDKNSTSCENPVI